jgi:hypothetical protein
MIDAILTNTLLPQIGHELLRRIGEGVSTTGIDVGIKDDGFNCQFQQ